MVGYYNACVGITDYQENSSRIREGAESAVDDQSEASQKNSRCEPRLLEPKLCLASGSARAR